MMQQKWKDTFINEPLPTFFNRLVQNIKIVTLLKIVKPFESNQKVFSLEVKYVNEIDRMINDFWCVTYFFAV